MVRGALGGLLSATLVLLPLVFSPGLVFVSYFAPLPFLFLGLSLGLRPLLTAGLLASLLVFLVEGPLLTAEFFLLSFLGPAFIVQRMLTHQNNGKKTIQWYPSAYIMRDFTLLSGIVLTLALGVYLYFIPDGNFAPFAKPFLDVLASHDGSPEVERYLNAIFPLLPGIFVLSWMIMLLLNTAIAQGLLVRTKANLRPTPSFMVVRLPQSFLIVLGLSLLLSFIGVGTVELLGKNAALTLTFPFFFAGLGVVHALFHKTSFAKWGLIAFYALLAAFFLWTAGLVIVLGVIRPWIEKESYEN